MSQQQDGQPPCQPDTGQPEPWEFDLDEVVTILWMFDTTGRVIGRTEYVHEDSKYLVEYPSPSGELKRAWAYAEALDSVN